MHMRGIFEVTSRVKVHSDTWTLIFLSLLPTYHTVKKSFSVRDK